MSNVRSAMKLGGAASIYPDSVDSFEELTFEFTIALNHALIVMGWYEHLAEGEIPPQWMWPFDDALEEWMDGVKADRKSQYSTDASDTEANMDSNDLASRFRNR